MNVPKRKTWQLIIKLLTAMITMATTVNMIGKRMTMETFPLNSINYDYKKRL